MLLCGAGHTIDEAVLVLLLTWAFTTGSAWKNFDWEAMGRLHAKGYTVIP